MDDGIMHSRDVIPIEIGTGGELQQFTEETVGELTDGKGDDE